MLLRGADNHLPGKMAPLPRRSQFEIRSRFCNILILWEINQSSNLLANSLVRNVKVPNDPTELLSGIEAERTIYGGGN
jgi:hypothetical protein